MSTVSGKALRAEIEKRMGDARQELSQARSLLARHRDDSKGLTRQVAGVRDALGRSLLPALTAEARARASQLLAFPALSQADPERDIALEQEALEARIAAIAADPRYVDRHDLRDPVTGTLTAELSEAQGNLDVVREVVARCEDHPRFHELLDAGYDTGDYAVPFWRMRYYNDWKAGDEVVASFPEHSRFADVRSVYLEARANVGLFRERVRSIQGEVAAGEALERELHAARTAIPALGDKHLAAWRERLTNHAEALDAGALGPRLGPEPDVALLVKTLRGLRAKTEYLQGIVREVDALETQLKEELRRLERDAMKAARPKNAAVRYDEARFVSRYRMRPAKLRKRQERLRMSYVTVWSFDDYDRYHFVDDLLWWDVMTDGRLDGDFIPEVAEHRRAHPGAVRERLDDDATARAAAAVAATSRDDDRLGGLDVS